MIGKKIFTLVIFISLTTATAFSQADEFHLDKTYQVDPKSTLSLKSDDADVTIIGSDRQDVHVTVDYRLDIDGLKFGDYKQFNMKITHKDGNLYIKEQPREMDGIVIGDTDEKYTITIKAPKTVSLALRGDDENYKITNINGKMRIDADDADVNCTNCSGGFFGFQLDDGTIKMNSGHGNLKVNFGDGNVYINNSTFNKIEIRADDADLKIQNKSLAGGVYQFRFGDATLELDLTKGRRSGNIQVGINGDDADVTVRTALKNNDEYHISGGDADIEFNVVNGGGMFVIQHDDASISSAAGYQILLNQEGQSKYHLNNGGAIIKMDVDDASVTLK